MATQLHNQLQTRPFVIWAGYLMEKRVHLWNRDHRKAVHAATELHCPVLDSAAELGTCHIVFCSLSDDEALEQARRWFHLLPIAVFSRNYNSSAQRKEPRPL
jgi:hypothetical protein